MLSSDALANLTDVRSLLGSITFDGAGHYSFIAQQTVGTAAASSQPGSGAYSVDPAGFVTMTNPLRPTLSLNARVGPEAIVGASTETPDNTFDLFLAIPAPSGTASSTSLNGSYWVATIEFPGASASAIRNTFFNLQSNGQGTFANFTVAGHVANQSAGKPSTQSVTGASYAISPDGSGSANFGAVSATALLSGNKPIYISNDGNVVLGGSTTAGAHDLLIGVKAVSAATNASWSDRFWGAGLRYGNGTISAYSGSLLSVGLGKATWTKRLHDLSAAATIDFTGVSPYDLKPDGSGTALSTQVGLGGGAFVGSAVDPTDPTAFEVYFGTRMSPVSGPGVFLNPQGIYNAASSAPAGNPISPGEFITLYGSGLASGIQTAFPPYPNSLGGAQVLINNVAAPIYSIQPDQFNILVPYATQGPTATIVVVNNGVSSNAVTVRVANTSPGVFAVNQRGSGEAKIQHLDYSDVTSSNPAKRGEIVVLYLSGLGAVNPSVPDGTAGGVNPFNTVVSPVGVLIGGRPATIGFSGLASCCPGLYQFNITVPTSLLPGISGDIPLAVQTPEAFHDQIDIAIGQ